jgi:hypothetical protein
MLVFSSCTKNFEDKNLIGDWKLYHANFDTPNLGSAFISNAKKSLESSNFNFQQDNHFQIIDLSNLGGSYTGIWDYSAKTKKLTFFYPDFKVDPEVFEVIKLSRNSLIIRHNIKSVGILEYKLRKIK